MSRSTATAAQGEHQQQQHQNPTNPHHSSFSSRSLLLDTEQGLLCGLASPTTCMGSTEAVETGAALKASHLSAPTLRRSYHHSLCDREHASCAVEIISMGGGSLRTDLLIFGSSAPLVTDLTHPAASCLSKLSQTLSKVSEAGFLAASRAGCDVGRVRVTSCNLLCSTTWLCKANLGRVERCCARHRTAG
jgi:hypothetical protein